MRPLIFLPLVALWALGGCAGEEPRSAARAPAPATAEDARPDPGERHIDRMQGRWQSLDDPALVIEVRGDQLISWYEEENLGAQTLDFVADCEQRNDEPAGEFFVLTDEAGALCYHLTYVDDAMLEYTYAERGNTLSYARVE